MAETREVEHGSLTAYTKDGCRCDPCREFWNAYMRWWRADQRGRLHGACPTCACSLPERPTPPTVPTSETPGVTRRTDSDSERNE